MIQGAIPFPILGTPCSANVQSAKVGLHPIQIGQFETMHTSEQLLANAFVGNAHGLDIRLLAETLQDWYVLHPQYNFLHPCVIDGRPALVCQANLSRIAPDTFAQLRDIAAAHGIYLKEDSRIQDQSPAHNRRRNACLVLSFCLSILATTRSVTANDLHGAQPLQAVAGDLSRPGNQPQAGMIVESGSVIRLRRIKPPTAADVIAAYSQKKATLQDNAAAADEIENFLRNLYHAESGDPTNIPADLAAIARYYAPYPQIIGLIDELRGQKLQLKYRAGTWQTQAWGSQNGVDSATISFDTRLGAQLLNDPGCDATPACSVSPADALLHELLHAKLMLLDSQHFIATGALSPGLYPFEHEREVIGAENQLYTSMNQLDGMARPIRHRHSGELMQVACPLCNPINQVASIALSQ